MITKVYINRRGEKYLVFHRTESGRYAETHSIETRDTCEACQKGTIPDTWKRRKR